MHNASSILDLLALLYTLSIMVRRLLSRLISPCKVARGLNLYGLAPHYCIGVFWSDFYMYRVHGTFWICMLRFLVIQLVLALSPAELCTPGRVGHQKVAFGYWAFYQVHKDGLNYDTKLDIGYIVTHATAAMLQHEPRLSLPTFVFFDISFPRRLA